MKVAIYYTFFLIVTPSVFAQAVSTWVNATSNSTWGTTANWSGGVANGVDAVADFSTLDIAAARTVSLGANWTVGTLTFGDAVTPSSNWALANGTGGPWALTLSGAAPTINIVNQTTTVSANLAGTQGFTKSGAGTLTLTGANTLTGGITLSAGTLNFNPGSLNGNVIDFTATATLGWSGTNTQDISAQIKIEDGVTATLATGANNIILTNSLQTGSTGTASVTKTGAGSLTLTAVNTYSGTTKVNAGRIVLSGGSDRLSSASSLTLGQTTGSGILQLGDGSGSSNQTFKSLAISGTGTGNAIVGGSATSSILTVNNSTAVTYTGLLGGSGTNENNIALTKMGSGTLTLTNSSNSFTGGITLNQGTLTFSNGSLAANLISVTGSATLQWAVASTMDVSTIGGLLIGDGFTATLDTNGNNVTLASPLQTGPLATGALAKANTGTLTLSAASSLTGGTTIRNGTLTLAGGDNRLAAASGVTLGNGANTNVTLQLGDSTGPSNQTLTSIATAGTGTTFIKGGSSAVSTLTLNNSTAKTFSGTLGSGTALSGLVDDNLALVKTGAGALTLSGTANSFVSDISITGGSLIIKNSRALGSGGKTVTVVGATNTPSLQLDGGLGDITLYAGLNLVTSNQNTTAPAILNVGGNNVINGTISPTNGGSGVGSTRIKVSAGTLTLNGNISPASTATSARTLILDGAGNGTVNGVISNGAVSLALTKDGTGTWVLNQANTFTGAVSVLNGTLEADNTSGSATGTGAVTVGSGGRLQGTGTIAGAVTVQSGGALQGGAGTPGTLTFSNKLTLSDGSSTEFHIADSASYDQIVAHQLVVGSGSTSTAVFRVVLDNGFTPVAGDSFHLLDWSSLLPGDTNLADNFDFSQATLSAGLNWDTSAFHSSGLLSVVAIPEPSRVLLLVISTGGWMLRRRRWPCN